MNPPTDSSGPSPVRAWLALVRFSILRQFRLRQMAAIALGLLALTLFVVGLVTARFGWDRTEVRLQRADPRNVQILTGGLALPEVEAMPVMREALRESQPLAVFSRWVVFFLFLGFLMPLWTLSFAVSAIGSERENRSLVWLLTRPIPRWGIYLAKLLGVLPWCVAFNLGGFGLMCVAGGEVGRSAFLLYWPGVLVGSIAFASIFHLIGAWFSRPAIVALLYSFFFETILSELPVPGTLKRLSISYYTRCLMYSSAREADVPTESDLLLVPVSDPLAWGVLLLGSVLVTLLGMRIFTKREYRDEV